MTDDSAILAVVGIGFAMLGVLVPLLRTMRSELRCLRSQVADVDKRLVAVEALPVTLETACTGTDVLEAVARAVWQGAAAGRPWSDCCVPTLEVLGEWLPQCPREALDEATRRLRQTAGISPDATVTTDGGHPLRIGWGRYSELVEDQDIPWLNRDPERPGGGIAAVLPFEYVSVAELHGLWLAPWSWERASDAQPGHPMAPLVHAWQWRATRSE